MHTGISVAMGLTPEAARENLNFDLLDKWSLAFAYLCLFFCCGCGCWLWHHERNKKNIIFFKIRSIMITPPLSRSSDNIHHTIIVTILILEHACLFHASSSKPSPKEALDRAYARFIDSNTYSALIEQFPAYQDYTTSQLVGFILNHRL